MTKKRTGVFVCHCGTNIAATVANLIGLEKHPAWDESLLEIR